MHEMYQHMLKEGVEPDDYLIVFMLEFFELVGNSNYIRFYREELVKWEKKYGPSRRRMGEKQQVRTANKLEN